MPAKPTLYYDVTQLVHWDGRLTGIPRVMHEQAIRFREQRPEAVFVSWVKELQEFVELDLDLFRQQLAKDVRGRLLVNILGLHAACCFGFRQTRNRQNLLDDRLLRKHRAKLSVDEENLVDRRVLGKTLDDLSSYVESILMIYLSAAGQADVFIGDIERSAFKKVASLASHSNQLIRLR